jgi:hypothetical protein
MKLHSIVPNSYIHVSVSDLIEYINRSQIHECRNWETEHYNSVLEITRLRFHFLEFINQNQTFILDFHRPFICSADCGTKDEKHRRTILTNLCPNSKSNVELQ